MPTLAVVALPLGAWVGGLYTALALHWLNIKGYKLTVVTPGAPWGMQRVQIGAQGSRAAAARAARWR